MVQDRSIRESMKSGEDLRFDFEKTHASSYEEEKVFFTGGASLRTPSWPRSYEKSIGFYFRSPEALGGQSDEPIKDLHLTDEEINKNLQDQTSLHEPLLRASFRDSYDRHLNQGLFQKNHTEESLSAGSFSSQEDLVRLHSINVRKSSFLQAVLNGMNTLSGVGILSMPYAVAQGGWIGLCVLLMFAMVCCYTGVLLRRCIDLHPAIQGYPDIGQAAFGKVGRIVISALLYFELFAVAVEFIILEGDNLTKLISWRGLDFGFVQLSPEQSFMLFSGLVMMPTVWLRDLSVISYISAGGVIASIVLFIVIAWVGIFDEGLEGQGHLINIQGFPIAIGLYAFCYCGHAVFPNIYTSMKDRSQFSYVLILCFILCTLLYGGMAVIGFLMFGDAIESQVTLNLPTGTVATKVAVAATLVNPFAKYALTLTPLAAAVEELVPCHAKGSWNSAAWGIMIRTSLVAITIFVSLVVPFFAYLMALVGSFLSTTVAITAPCICYMKLFGGRIPMWEKILLWLLLPVGFIATIAGTYSSVLELVRSILT